MIIVDIEQDTPEWLEERKGKIGGSKLKDIVTKRGGRKLGSYQLIADQIAKEADDEDVRDRGHRLEVEALEMLEGIIEKDIDKKCGMWVSDEDPNIYVSPDGGIKNKKGEYSEAVEVKALNSARQIQAIIENEIPDEYHYQVIQYFIVNEKLERLYFTFYDPRITARPIHIIEVTRDEVQAEVVRMKEFEVKEIAWVNEWVERLTF